MDELRRESVRRFVQIADEDLHVAQMCLAGSRPAYHMAAFDAQPTAMYGR